MQQMWRRRISTCHLDRRTSTTPPFTSRPTSTGAIMPPQPHIVSIYRCSRHRSSIKNIASFTQSSAWSSQTPSTQPHVVTLVDGAAWTGPTSKAPNLSKRPGKRMTSQSLTRPLSAPLAWNFGTQSTSPTASASQLNKVTGDCRLFFH